MLFLIFSFELRTDSPKIAWRKTEPAQEESPELMERVGRTLERAGMEWANCLEEKLGLLGK